MIPLYGQSGRPGVVVGLVSVAWLAMVCLIVCWWCFEFETIWGQWEVICKLVSRANDGGWFECDGEQLLRALSEAELFLAL